jgi:hypothetical protein
MTAKPITAEDIRSLWQSMPSDTVAISAEDMRMKAQKFQTGIRVRNFIEYAAFAFVSVFFTKAAWEATTWQGKAAAVGMILSGFVAVWNLYRRGRAIATPTNASAVALIDFQRSELSRQRDVLLTTWRWYFLPFVPGIAFFCVIAWMGLLGNGVPIERVQRGVIVVLILFFAIFAIGMLLQLLGAAHLQRRIEDLDRYKEK